MDLTVEQFKVFHEENATIAAQMSDWLAERADYTLPVELKYFADEENSTAIFSYVENKDRVDQLKRAGYDVASQEFVEIYVSKREDGDLTDDVVSLADIFATKLNDWRTKNITKTILRMEFSVTSNFYGALLMFCEAPNKQVIDMTLKKKSGKKN